MLRGRLLVAGLAVRSRKVAARVAHRAPDGADGEVAGRLGHLEVTLDDLCHRVDLLEPMTRELVEALDHMGARIEALTSENLRLSATITDLRSGSGSASADGSSGGET
jgi:hypothetical protein